MSLIPILGIDPGFANCGYAVVLLGADGTLRPTSMGVFNTDKSTAKRNVLASDDNVRRSREIYRFMRDLLRDGPHGVVRAICAETMSFPRNASTSAKMALCWGVVAALSEEFDIPVLQATPQGLKLAVAGNRSASKEDIKKALEKKFGKQVLTELCEETTASKQEHPFDALGAVVACGDSEVLRLARRMSAG
jgi:Holliday junction resolvasome RuvABC endonuclease subunit